MAEQKTPEQILERIKVDLVDAQYGYGHCDNSKYYQDMKFMMEQLEVAKGLRPEQTNVKVVQKKLDELLTHLAAEKKAHLITLDALRAANAALEEASNKLRLYNEAEAHATVLKFER